MSDLGKLFREIRLSKNWSIRQAAKNMGISYSYLSILEKGKDPRTGKNANPKPEMLKIISKAYNYPYEELMKTAGYLNDDHNFTRKFDLTIFANNLKLIMGNMEIETLSKDIYDKTRYRIIPDQIKSYLKGDIQPFPGTINILSKYAQVRTDFWFRYNTEQTLIDEKKKYKENLLESACEHFSNEYIRFSDLPDNIKQFTIDKENHAYLKAVIEAKMKGISPHTLKLLIQTIANEIESYK
ncbi:MAG: helix-turn-helix transcriptional regulator [Clostridiaceae bacterium]|nr:helix-turn-helix transcriptional regulator [Clostridiaceae bacterium]